MSSTPEILGEISLSPNFVKKTKNINKLHIPVSIFSIFWTLFYLEHYDGRLVARGSYSS